MLFGESELIYNLRGKVGISNLHFQGDWTNEFDETYHIIISEHLGSSLEDLFQKSNRKFDLSTVLNIGVQMFERIELVHNEGIIHRDITPESFLIGGTEATKDIIFIDSFAQAKKFKRSSNN